jgi:hypothetical protein
MTAVVSFSAGLLLSDTSTIGNVGHHQLVAAQVPAASAVFTKDSSIVLLAQAKGAITVYDTHTRNVLDVVRVGGPTRRKHAHIHQHGAQCIW